MLFLFLGIASLALFSFLAVAVFSGERRREREAYYKSEAIKKVAESQGAGGGNAALELLREEERMARSRRQEGQKLGGLITFAVGVGMVIFLRKMIGGNEEPAYLVGIIPILIGLVLLIYAYFLAPKE